MRLCCSMVVVTLIVAPLLRAGEVLDRLVATVNGHAILQSDWNNELQYECFMSGRTLHDLTPEDRRAAFERLIDQELLHEQADGADFKPASPEQIAAEVDGVKIQYTQQHPGRPWATALQDSGISEVEIETHVANELNSLRLVDARLRPSIQIDLASIQDYYDRELQPKFTNGQRITLQEAAPKIREILLQERMNALLNSWLETLRSQAKIHIVAEQAAETPATKAEP
jgi:peptidyl-prolyl cis-trans isomerase SurA